MAIKWTNWQFMHALTLVMYRPLYFKGLYDVSLYSIRRSEQGMEIRASAWICIFWPNEKSCSVTVVRCDWILSYFCSLVATGGYNQAQFMIEPLYVIAQKTFMRSPWNGNPYQDARRLPCDGGLKIGDYFQQIDTLVSDYPDQNSEVIFSATILACDNWKG